MDPFIWILVIATIYSIVVQNWHAWERAKPQIEITAPEEEPIDDILARFRQERRTRRARQKNEWDEKYLLSLPVEEHPDYFELDLKSDEVDEFVQKSADGVICHSFKSRRNSRGVPYSLEVDHITQTASVSTGTISWEVPLSRVDNWKELA